MCKGSAYALLALHHQLVELVELADDRLSLQITISLTFFHIHGVWTVIRGTTQDNFQDGRRLWWPVRFNPPSKEISLSPASINTPTNLQQTQILQPSLDQLLYPTLLRLLLVLTEGISRLATGIFTEVVVGELGRLTQQGAELEDINISTLRQEQRTTWESINPDTPFRKITHQRPSLEGGIAVQRSNRHGEIARQMYRDERSIECAIWEIQKLTYFARRRANAKIYDVDGGGGSGFRGVAGRSGEMRDAESHERRERCCRSQMQSDYRQQITRSGEQRESWGSDEAQGGKFFCVRRRQWRSYRGRAPATPRFSVLQNPHNIGTFPSIAPAKIQLGW
jgi:hypothetical protein